MTSDRVDIIDRSVEKTHIWLSDLAAELDTEDRHYAYRVLRAFLHALRDHLSVENAAQLAAQLPIFIRGLFYEGYSPSRTPEHVRDRESFLERIASEAILAGPTEASFAVEAASAVLREHISPGEVDSVLQALPEHIRELVATGAVAR
jgi:uncharacterized protein (DUF2267 family)